MSVIEKLGAERLKPIKRLPEEISYEDIQLVSAKIYLKVLKINLSSLLTRQIDFNINLY